MSTFRSSNRCLALARPLVRVFGLLCIVYSFGEIARGEDSWIELPMPKPSVNVAGLSLPSTIDDFAQQYPDAKISTGGLDGKIGLACFDVAGVKDADGAKFYFLDDKFYQVTIDYSPAQVENQGGMAAVVRKLIASLGPADRAYTGRWTWWLTANRRADFYTDRQGGQFVVTDTTLANLVDQRTKNQTLTGDIEFVHE